MRLPLPLTAVLAAIVGVFFASAVLVPLGAVLSRAVGSVEALLDPVILHIAALTAAQAAASAAIAMLLGLPLGLWLARIRGRGVALCEGLLALPFGIPTVVAAMAWVSWLGRSGPLGSLNLSYGFEAVILAHVAFNVPWVALLVSQARRAVPEPQLDAARTLGAGKAGIFLQVTWPGIRWALGSAGVQVFSLCAMSFALVLILGGGPPVQTLETALYSRVRYGGLDLSGATACAFWQLLLTGIPWALLIGRIGMRGGAPQPTVARGGSSSRTALVLGILLCGSFLIPYLPVLRGATLSAIAAPEAVEAWRISLLIAGLTSVSVLTTALAAVALGALFRSRPVRQAFELLMAVPSGVSTLALALGIWLAYSRWIDPFEGSLTAIILVQTAIFFPVAYRVLWPVARGLQRREIEAALTLGAPPVRAYLAVEWPRWRAPIASAFALVLGASLGEVAAVSLFYSEKLIPVPLLITRWMGQYRFEEAEALASSLFLGAALLIALVSVVQVLRRNHVRPVR